MRRTLALTLTMTSLLAIACGEPTPTSPSGPAVASVPVAFSIGQAAPPALFGAGVVDFARCLRTASSQGCLTARRITLRDAGAGITAPGAPADLVATAAGSTVTLTWSTNGNDAATTFVIEAGSAPGLANLANFPTGSATSFSANGVGAGTYYVRVRAQNEGGVSGASNEAILIVSAAGCTSAPGASGGLATSVSGSTVTLTWNPPAAGCTPSSYVLEAGSSSGSSDLANVNVGGGTSYVADGVGTGTYYVRVRAVNAYGRGAGSNEVVLTITSGGGTPPPTTSVTGRWVGVAPGGVIVELDPTDQCPAEYDLELDLTSSGTALTGTAITRLRRVEAAGDCSNVFGEVATWSVINGTVGSDTISFALGNSGVFRLSGRFTATRMTGTVVLREFTPFYQAGSFSLNRQ
jgi:predicted phage tail protein